MSTDSGLQTEKGNKIIAEYAETISIKKSNILLLHQTTCHLGNVWIDYSVFSDMKAKRWNILLNELILAATISVLALGILLLHVDSDV